MSESDKMRALGEKTQFRNGDEAAESGRKGGQKSGETRRRRRDMKTILNQIAKMDVANDKLKALLEDAGLNPTYEEAIGYSIVNGAIRGNPRMTEQYMKYSGQDKLRELEIKEKQGQKGQAGGGDMAKLIDALTAGAAIDWEKPEDSDG